jgi:hypothetical protein
LRTISPRPVGHQTPTWEQCGQAPRGEVAPDTQAMTEHYSHVGRDENLATAGSVVRLVLGVREGGSSEEQSGGSSRGSLPNSDPSDAATGS